MSKHAGTIILERLSALDKNQSWLAEQAGVSINAVSKWIRTGKISRDNAIKVAGILGISTDTLLTQEPTGAGNFITKSVSLIYVDVDELRLITAYRESTPLGKALIEAATEGAPKAKLTVGLSGTNHKS